MLPIIYRIWKMTHKLWTFYEKITKAEKTF